jgi:hypothetical protein
MRQQHRDQDRHDVLCAAGADGRSRHFHRGEPGRPALRARRQHHLHGSWQVPDIDLSNSYEPLKTKAREVGANGVIIDNSSQVISGIISRGISVDARAIRLATPPVAAGASAATQGGASKDDAEALRQLQKLHQDGVITDREYEQKKAEILRRM